MDKGGGGIQSTSESADYDFSCQNVKITQKPSRIQFYILMLKVARFYR